MCRLQVSQPKKEKGDSKQLKIQKSLEKVREVYLHPEKEDALSEKNKKLLAAFKIYRSGNCLGGCTLAYEVFDIKKWRSDEDKKNANYLLTLFKAPFTEDATVVTQHSRAPIIRSPYYD